MARRIAWTNNSSGHDGTRIFRDTAPMDPQALPAPLATVAAGTTEYIDSETLADGTYYYRVQDYQGASVSAASEEQSFIITPDYANAQVGDEIGGGIYAGLYTDGGSSAQWHIVVSKAADEYPSGDQWSDRNWVTGADSMTDGLLNQQTVLGLYDGGSATNPESFITARNHTAGGFDDWYIGSPDEWAFIRSGLSGHTELSELAASEDYIWLSTEVNDDFNKVYRMSDGFVDNQNKDAPGPRSRLIRRVAA